MENMYMDKKLFITLLACFMLSLVKLNENRLAWMVHLNHKQHSKTKMDNYPKC